MFAWNGILSAFIWVNLCEVNEAKQGNKWIQMKEF